MTLEEVSKKYNVAESTLKNSWPRAQKSILKKYNVNLIKKGRGASATYEEEVYYPHAITMYDEIKEEDMFLDNQSFHLRNGEFLVFLAILTTPMLVFRGNYIDFLKYIGINPTENNITTLKESLAALEEDGFIEVLYDVDEYFTATLRRVVEKQLNIGIGMIRKCKELAEQHHKRSWIPLLKTWIGIRIAYDDQPTTLEELSNITGLSIPQIRESKRILESSEDELFKMKLEYSDYNRCIGQSIELNGFFN